MNSEASAQNPAEDVETHPGHHRNKWWEKEKNPESYISSGGVETSEIKINLMFTRMWHKGGLLQGSQHNKMEVYFWERVALEVAYYKFLKNNKLCLSEWSSRDM